MNRKNGLYLVSQEHKTFPVALHLSDTKIYNTWLI
jgi:hypothetical protein